MLFRILALAIAAFVAAVAAAPAYADGYVIVGVDGGRHHGPLQRHFHPAYRYWRPVYPAYYVVAPPVQVAPAYTITPTTCRVFQGDAVIDQSQRPFFGRACLYADSRWHIVD
ncbi:MAG: hypothetical protein EXQ91_04070 [Alphaproteobacteria bacterium]|nr:hypothetical protein [Alphaproteobacteria bacterium]